MAVWLPVCWQRWTLWHVILLPLSWIFLGLVSVRRALYRCGFLSSYRLSVPVIVVGNINVGGVGKTPLVIWLAQQLKAAGYHPGIVSRGYGGRAHQATAVWEYSRPQDVGDEPVLIAKRTACPVFVGHHRVKAGQALLLAHPECDVIISDDGLQHYRLQRDVEIAVVDGINGLGNAAMLPAGPLRESLSRLKEVDLVVHNGVIANNLLRTQLMGVPQVEMQLQASSFYNLKNSHETCTASAFANKTVLAVAGIGNPERFFKQLAGMDIKFRHQSYPDHYDFCAKDFASLSVDVVLMTEKDAVKCQEFAQDFWVLPVHAVIRGDLMNIILSKLGH